MTVASLPESPAPAARTAPPAGRSLRGALRRHPWLLFIIGVLVAAAVLVAGPFLPRHYILTADLTLHSATMPSADSPASDNFDLARQANQQLQRLTQSPAHLISQIDVSSASPGSTSQVLNIRAVARDPTAAYVALSEAIRDFAASAASAQRTAQDAARSAAREKLAELQQHAAALQHNLETMDAAHPGLAPDDVAGPAATAQQIQTRLTDAQQRLDMLRDQQSSLAALSAATPTTASAAPAAATPANAAHDPEVLGLQAQLALLNEQVDRQLGALHRTEQHPYVVDLRRQQADLEKKLALAQARAARGEAPPASAQQAASDNGPNFAQQALALQRRQVDQRITQLTTEIAALRTQLSQQQAQANALLPLRRQRAAVANELAATQKQAAQWQDAAAAPASAAAPVSDINLAPPPESPAFPQLWAILALALLLGLTAGVAAAWLADRRDRSIHSVHEFAGMSPLPVLGSVSEIATPQTIRRRHIRQLLVAPVASLILIAVVLAAALFAWRGLAATHFSDQLASQGPHGVWLMMTRAP